MPDFDLSVTICSWNTRDDLRVCLQSLRAVAGEARTEVIVVDNNSEDRSAQMVEEEFPEVTLLAMSENLGFGKGHNKAFEVARGGVLFPLNSDAVMHEGCFARVLEFLRSDPNIGVVGPKLLNPDGSLQYSARRFPTPMAALFRNTPLGKLFPKNRYTRDYLMTDWAHDEPRDVDWVSGAAFAFKRELYEQIGGFDERFFMFLEDVDLCYRAHAAGRRVVYLPEAIVTHKIGSSTDKAPNRMINQFHKSMLLYYKKHYLSKVSPPLRPFAIAGSWLLLIARQSLFIIKNKIDDWNRRRSK
ncbi:MAG: glycosyltransferase family 2 protein [Fimbriimonadales bacterium]